MSTSSSAELANLDTPVSSKNEPTITNYTSAPLTGSNVLIIEGSHTKRQLFEIILKEAGANVTSAVDGGNGVHLAIEQEFDVVLVDMQMPLLDGIAIASTIRGAGVATPIVAHGMANEERQCRDVGCSGFLSKPTDAEQLLRCVVSCIGQSIVPNAVSSRPSQVDVESAPKSGVAGDATESNEVQSQKAQVSKDDDGLHCSLALDKPIYLEILFEFVDELPSRLDAMSTALEQHEWDQLAEVAHALKGSGGSIGYHAFTTPCRDLEAYARQKDPERTKVAFDSVKGVARSIVVPDRD